MDIKTAYYKWANQYDSDSNKTRDLEGVALRENLEKLQFDTCLEIGCGTGKNTEWLINKTDEIVAIDLSDKMLSKAKDKISSGKVEFIQADITQAWNFVTKPYDLITFSLVLEHIEDIAPIFKKASDSIKKDGYMYVGELHPFKQYSGSKARFETKEGEQTVKCFNHNISEFTHSAKNNGFNIVNINEHFDANDRNSMPRILSILFQKK